MMVKKININWEDIIETWYFPLKKDLLNSKYVERLIKFLYTEYTKKYVFPKMDSVFKAFRLTPYNDVRVVILGQDPYYNGEANGLAFGINEDSIRVPPSLRKIIGRIESLYGMQLGFDVTLEKWAKQGVLLLNTSLTVVKKEPNSHSLQWSLFTKQVIKNINENKTGIIFLLWGKEAQSYSVLINERKHHVLKFEHPAYAARQNRDWKCDSFNVVNDLIEEQNGKEFKIEW